MKRYWITLIMTSLCTAVFAQDLGVYEATHEMKNPLETLYNKVVRLLATQQKTDWARSINRQRRAAVPHRSVGLKFDQLFPRKATPVPARLAPVLNPRLTLWKQAMSANPVINRYILKVTRPQDLAEMSVKQANFLLRFLRNPVTMDEADPNYLPVNTEELAHYLVRLTFKTGPQDPPLYLVFNCYTQEMFIALGNTDTLGLPMEPKTPIQLHPFH